MLQMEDENQSHLRRKSVRSGTSSRSFLKNLEASSLINLDKVFEHFVTVSNRINQEALLPGFEFFALMEAALPKTLDHLVGEKHN